MADRLATTPHALALDGLSKRYGNVVAIDDLSLRIRSGEFLSLLGPSGSGKSTVLMAIAGFVEPDRGDILLDGVRINALPPEKRRFGVVFQGYALFPHMTVRENIGYPLKLRAVRGEALRAQVDRVMDLVHLRALADRVPRNLSGGQQQRVALARALVFDPEVVLLDEPLSALDRKLRTELQIELKALHERLGTTFVNVTHDQEEAMTMSDRIVILHHGRAQQIGTPEALYDRPATRFVAEFLGRASFLEAEVRGEDGTGLVLAARGHEFRHEGKGPPPGSRVTVALRPERVILGDAPAAGANRVEGRVRTALFVGTRHVYVVETALGDLEVAVPTVTAGAKLAPGSPCHMSWSPSAGVLVEDR